MFEDISSRYYQVQSALKRGVAYGILKKIGGHYNLPTDSELARQEVAIQEIDLLDLYCQRKINRSRGFKAPTEKNGRSRRAGNCKCGKKRKQRRSRGCAPGSCVRLQKKGRRQRRRRRSRRRGGCRCGGRSARVSQEAAKSGGARDQKGELIGSDIETEATAVIGTEHDGHSSSSGSSSPERMAANNNSEQQDCDMPLSH